ncbi:MAG: hypothetical protein WCT27_03310 [Patescibacteria group bacterium]
MNTISDQALEKLKSQHMKPIPRWEFLLKDSVIWAGFMVAVLVGSVAYCVALFLLTTQDWDLYRYVGSNAFADALSGLPYLWLIILLLFVLLAMYNFRHTQSGYRYRVWGVIVASIGASIVIGSVLHVTGFGNYLDRVMADNLPVYRQLTPDRQSVWTQPEKGLLSGKILTPENLLPNTVTIRDFKGKKWLISVNSALVDPSVRLEIGQYIKLVGQKTSTGQFQATHIMPWNMQRWIEEYETSQDQSILFFTNPGQSFIIRYN